MPQITNMDVEQNNKCGLCQLQVTNKGLQCDYCDKWFHPACESLNDQEYVLMSAPRFKFFCTACNDHATGILKFLHEVKKKNEVMDKRITECEKQLKSVTTFQKEVEGNFPQMVRDEVYEIRNKESKIRNLAISNLPEIVDDDNPEENTTQTVSSFFREALDLGDIIVKEAKRINNPPGREGQTRMVITTLDTKEMKYKVLNKAKDLRKSSNQTWKDVYISPDQTKKERQLGYQLRQQLRDRRAQGETNLIIRGNKIITENQNAPSSRGNRGNRGGPRGGRGGPRGGRGGFHQT